MIRLDSVLCEVKSSVAAMGSSLVASSGLGIGVLAGLVTGVYCLVAYGRRKFRAKKGECHVCGKNFRATDHILGGDDVITCSRCSRRVCRLRCSTSLGKKKGWSCCDCLYGATKGVGWYQIVLDKIVHSRAKMQSESSEEVDLEEAQTYCRQQVQDFMEKLVNAILGQKVDDASVTKVYDDRQYLPLEGESPCTAHAALKQLIENLLKEAVDLPKLWKQQNQPPLPHNLIDRTYEDLLATAILNKVVVNCQNALPTSSAISQISNNSRNEKEFFFGEETLSDKWRSAADPETDSMSSLESWLHSDSSFGSRKYVDKVTLTIKQDIEDVSRSDDTDSDQEGGEQDNAYCSRSKEEEERSNWFLQRKQFQGTHSPVPVPMLIPDPTTNAKVLIGDTEADETSDLSDVGSEYGEDEPETLPGRCSVLLDSKTIIGGKNRFPNGGAEDSESSADSGVKEIGREGHQRRVYVSKADITIDDENVEDSSFLSIYSNTEKEAEYTEKYASLPRTILKSPTPPSRQSLNKDVQKIPKTVPKHSNSSDDETEMQIEEKFPGNYSRREKEKWKHAVEMKNNPYSKEKLEKRITRSHSAVTTSLFGPDYYARQASSPAGVRLRSTESRKGAGFPAYDEDILESYYSQTQLHTTEEGDVNLHRAVPVIVHQEAEQIIEQVVKPRPNHPPGAPGTGSTSGVTSDSDMSYINFYDVENSKVYKTTNGKPDENENSETVRHENQVTEKPKYLKLKSTVQPNTSRKKVDVKQLRRNKSETDLSLDTFDYSPTVLSKKKDNTLISKIYLDPHVRNFAMTSRKELPIQSLPTSPFRSQTSLIYCTGTSNDTFENLSSSAISMSDSKDDLLNSVDSNQAKNYEVKSARMSLSSEDDLLSQHDGTRKFIYSSSDDLLSIEENERPQRKKDNTLISKIYKQTNVRNYALSNRDYIMGEDKKKLTSSDEDVVFYEVKPAVRAKDPPIEDQIDNIDPGVGEIAKRKIVHQVLSQLSKVDPKLKIVARKISVEDKMGAGDEEISVSVRDLKKKFENQGKNIVVSSLTARSLSKKVKDYLKK